MAGDFDRILDECIDRVNRGESPAACVSDYPEHAEKLGPMLQSMSSVRKTYAFTPSADAKREARQKLYAALDERRKKASVPWFSRLLVRPVVWVAVAALVLGAIGLWGIRPALLPPELAPHPNGNFALLISDEPNDIGDFVNLDVTISRVGLQKAGSGDWTEFTPETKTVDLTRLQGAASQEIWRGDIPAGQYSEVLVYVSDVRGKLKATGQVIEVKLPSNKLQLSMPFQVSNDSVTRFTFDITVISAGNSGKYILKPQIGESGAQQDKKPPEPPVADNRPKGKK